MSIASQLADVRARIERAARAVGRDPASVRLVAVSKTKPAAAIREAYAAGQRDFGENYAQELAEKAAELCEELPDVRWHFIGHLQSNKAKLVAPVAHLVHAVDSAALAHALAKRVPPGAPPLRVLVEVNTGGEAEKHGVAPADAGALLDAIAAEPSLVLGGLMTMPPHDLDAARRAFEALVALRDRHGGAARLPELSMGMSDDLEVAIACGATIVRVGTAIFGAR
ncbi:MAG: YggS family pyridoxal phosphate-dependent enzyme [Labilithrix sp.]|nr:YggS family pyridoxal phosphate-dependent enzyme [Labilithrix sp.]MCW5810721.1 YggS family pyridoxal phosphate-dependent enzyme [Labilithrix sp.]